MNAEQAILVKRLKEAGLHTRRFLKLKPDKRPLELEWQKNPYTPEELEAEGYERWGIIGRTRLVCIDTDTEEMANIIKKIMPPTFESISPRRKLPHFPFHIPDGDVPNKDLFMDNGKGGKVRVGEIRAQDKYLVAPGSEIRFKDLRTGEEKTGRYEILHDRPIATVSHADFMKAFEPYFGGGPSQRITFEQMRKGVPTGERHAQGIKYATFLIGAKQFDAATALHELRAWNQLNKPPMADHDLIRMVQSAGGYVAGKPHDPKKYFTLRENGKINKFVPGRLGEDIKKIFRFATTKDDEEVYVYREGIYKRGGEVLIKEEARERLTNELAREGYIYETVAHIRETTYVDRSKFDNPYNLMAVENGLLDVLTCELQPHTPEKMVITKIPVLYDKDAKCPKIEKFLSEVHYEADIQIIQETVGYCLLKRYPFAKAFMLLGPGENGKSTELNLIGKFLGEENVTSPSLQDLLYNRFSKAELYGKLADIHADIPSTTLERTGTFKMLTGGDTLYMERKNRDPFYAKNYAKLLYSANELPKTTDLTLAFFRRWVLIRFPNRFPEGGPTTDPHLLEKLTTPEELSGFLNWALEGLRRLLKQGRFTQTKTRQEIENEWVMETDSLRAFRNARVRVEQDTFTTKSQFYERYLEFCTEHDLNAVTMSAVGHRLPSIIPQTSEIHPKVGGKQVKAWKDIYITDITENNSHSPTSKQDKLCSREYKEAIFKKRNIGNIEKATPTNLSQSERIKRICEIIDVLAKEYGGAAPIEEVKRIAESEGITPSFVDELIDQEKQRLHMCEPKPGFVARTGAAK